MRAALLAGLLAGYGIAVPVGPVAAYLVALTARTSWRVGAAAALGVATADGLYALGAALAGAALAPAISAHAQALRWTSAAVLAAVAAHVAWSGTRSGATAAPGPREPRPVQAYVRLLGLTLLNPSTVVYFAALVTGVRVGADVSAAEQAVFVVAALAASASWQLLVAAAGLAVGRTLTGRRGRLLTAWAASVLIGGLALRVALSG